MSTRWDTCGSCHRDAPITVCDGCGADVPKDQAADVIEVATYPRNNPTRRQTLDFCPPCARAVAVFLHADGGGPRGSGR